MANKRPSEGVFARDANQVFHTVEAVGAGACEREGWGGASRFQDPR
ncbi:hypothetical protein JOE50_003521 [Bradyrhizobium japonicum]|nr:hypothetical protein [Bradyrhizobium japonicum]